MKVGKYVVPNLWFTTELNQTPLKGVYLHTLIKNFKGFLQMNRKDEKRTKTRCA